MQEVGREKMTELEKILEEIKKIAIFMQTTSGYGAMCVSTGAVEHIIRKHMNDGWIPVEERLPADDGLIEDDECPEFNVTIRGAEEATTLKYSPADSTWFDDYGYVYDVIAWCPLPEPYRPERSEDMNGQE